MPATTNLLKKLNSLQQLLVLYQRKSKQLKQPSPAHQQQISKLEKLYQQLLKTLAVASLEEAPQEEDWISLLQQADLPQENKEQLKQLLAVNPKEEENRAYVKMVVGFYKKYYSNQQKYAEQLDFGIDISPQHYQHCLQQAITFTIKKKGKAATAIDFSAHFVLLLKGFLKENALKKGEVEYSLKETFIPQETKGTTLTITAYQLEEEWPDVTDWLNKKPPFAKSAFNIASTTIAIEVAGSGALAQDKPYEKKENFLGDFLTVTGEALCKEIEVVLQDKIGNSNLALAEGKLTFNLPLGITVEIGVKIAELVSSVGVNQKWEGNITPIEIAGQIALDFKAIKALVTDHPFYDQLLDLNLKVELNVSTELGVDLLSNNPDKITKQALDALDEKEKLVTKKQLQLLKQQEAYIELAEKTKHSQQLYQERQQLLEKAKTEVNPKKKKQLQKKAFDKAVDLQKQKQLITQKLQDHHAISLEDLDKSIKEEASSLQKTLQKNKLHIDKISQKIEDKTQQILLKVAKRQSTKKLLSLIAKVVPVLNVISTVVDIYDAVVFLNEMKQLYQQSDLQLPQDEQLQQIENATIDVTTLAPILPDFFYSIGAGGKLLLLSPEEAEELTQFLQKEFPEGINSVDYVSFCMAYGDHYEVVGGRIKDTEDLFKDLKTYLNEYSSQLESREADTISIEEIDTTKTNPSSFFDRARYTIKEGDATDVGSIIKVDATCIDTRKDGSSMQISFPDDNLLKLKVIQNLGDGEFKLKPLEEYILHVKGFKKYILNSTTVFLYNLNSDSLTTRNK